MNSNENDGNRRNEVENAAFIDTERLNIDNMNDANADAHFTMLLWKLQNQLLQLQIENERMQKRVKMLIHMR